MESDKLRIVGLTVNCGPAAVSGDVTCNVTATGLPRETPVVFVNWMRAEYVPAFSPAGFAASCTCIGVVARCGVTVIHAGAGVSGDPASTSVSMLTKEPSTAA